MNIMKIKTNKRSLLDPPPSPSLNGVCFLSTFLFKAREPISNHQNWLFLLSRSENRLKPKWKVVLWQKLADWPPHPINGELHQKYHVAPQKSSFFLRHPLHCGSSMPHHHFLIFSGKKKEFYKSCISVGLNVIFYFKLKCVLNIMCWINLAVHKGSPTASFDKISEY